MTDAPQSIYVATEAGEPVAWAHTLHMEGGQTRRTLVDWKALAYYSAFGEPGKDHSEEYPVTCEPLYATPRISTEPFPGAVEYRKGEREAIVAWLRRQSVAILRLHDEATRDEQKVPLAVMTRARAECADALERGAHLPTSEGDAQ